MTERLKNKFQQMIGQRKRIGENVPAIEPSVTSEVDTQGAQEKNRKNKNSRPAEPSLAPQPAFYPLQ